MKQKIRHNVEPGCCLWIGQLDRAGFDHTTFYSDIPVGDFVEVDIPGDVVGFDVRIRDPKSILVPFQNYVSKTDSIDHHKVKDFFYFRDTFFEKIVRMIKKLMK